MPATAGTVSGAGHAVGGDLAQNNDHTANLADRMPLVIDFVLLPTFLIMAVTFRSEEMGVGLAAAPNQA